MRGFADAENILLDQSQVLEADLDGQIPARDHHPEPRQVQACQEQLGQSMNGLSRLDLDHDPDIRIAELLERRPQIGEVARPASP